MQNYKIFCPSGSIMMVLQVTLKQVNFYHIIFHDTTLKSYFKPWPLSEIFTIMILWHAKSRIRTCIEPEFRLWWMKLCSSITTTPQCHKFLNFSLYILLNYITLIWSLHSFVIQNIYKRLLHHDLCYFSKWSRYKRADMIMKRH